MTPILGAIFFEKKQTRKGKKRIYKFSFFIFQNF